MPEETKTNLDVKDTTATSSARGDAMLDSSTTQTATKQDENANVSMLEFVKSRVNPENNTNTETKTEETSTEEVTQEEQTEQTEETTEEIQETTEESPDKKGEEGKENEEDKKTETTETNEQAQPDPKEGEPVPYDRFKQVNDNYRKLEAQTKESEPIIQAHRSIVDYCTANNISHDQFQKALEVQALLNTNPEEALKRLIPIVEAIQGFVGDKLPPDLQKEVDDGKLDLSYARRIAKAEARQKFGQMTTEQMQRVQQERANQAHLTSLTNSVVTWAETKAKTDPDFRPKKGENAPDGKYEMVHDKFAALAGAMQKDGRTPVNPIKTAADAVALMERAYKAVEATLAPYTKKPPTRKPLTQNGSSRSTSAKTVESAGTMREGVALYLAQQGRI